VLQAYGYLKDDGLRLQLAQRFNGPRAHTSQSAAWGASAAGPGSFYNPRASARRASGDNEEKASNTWQYYKQQERGDAFNGPFSRYNTNDDPAPPKHMGCANPLPPPPFTQPPTLSTQPPTPLHPTPNPVFNMPMSFAQRLLLHFCRHRPGLWRFPVAAQARPLHRTGTSSRHWQTRS
jgi:hypothetical protein